MSDLPTVLARCLVVAPVLFLSACFVRPVHAPAPVPVPAYVAPGASVPVATLVMRHELQDDHWYRLDLFADPERCAGRSRVGQGGRTIDPAPTRLAAGRWQTFEAWVREPGATCTVRLSFAPAPGRTYLVMTKSRPDGACTATLQDVTDPDAVRFEPSMRQRYVGNQACRPLAQSAPPPAHAEQLPSKPVTDLPIDPMERDPAATRPRMLPAPSPTPAVSADDLSGLTER